ncbi:hypothetical protein [Paramicrobacterium fandaimingii]|uniref:hypothetical protein n=1 Tax=Paramicrobacterium fandaimingii TaxID=2708079 RepID=UPI00141FD553|nr:hypothetical protein [Microbacterium fandaimingii]
MDTFDRDYEAAVDRAARKRAKANGHPDDPVEIDLCALEVIAEHDHERVIRDIVERLRTDGRDRVTMRMIGARLGKSEGAVWNRYMRGGHEKQQLSPERKAYAELPGYKLTEAADITGMSRATINNHIKSDPKGEGEWYQRFELEYRKTPETRIIDLDGLRARRIRNRKPKR